MGYQKVVAASRILLDCSRHGCVHLEHHKFQNAVFPNKCREDNIYVYNNFVKLAI